MVIFSFLGGGKSGETLKIPTLPISCPQKTPRSLVGLIALKKLQELPPIGFIYCLDDWLCYPLYENDGDIMINSGSNLQLIMQCEIEAGSNCKEPLSYRWYSITEAKYLYWHYVGFHHNTT